MSYRDPKSTSKDISGIISTSLSQTRQREEQQKQRQSNNINTLIGSVDNAITGSLAAKRKAMRKLDQSIAKSNKKIYKEIDGIGLEERGDQFDEMTRSFLGDVAKDFGNVNRAMAEGVVDNAVGRNDKAVLKNVVNTFATSYPQLLAVYDQLEESAKKRNNGEIATTLSVTGPYADQLNVIKNIKESSPGISFERTPGGGVLVRDNTDPENPQTLDLNEFAEAMKKNKFLKFVPDLSKPIAASYNNIMDDKAGKATFTSFDPNNNDENTAILEMDLEQEKALKNKMTGDYLINNNISIEETRKREEQGLPPSDYKTGGQFRTMIEDSGDMIWEDIMPQKDAPEYPDVVPGPFDEAIGKQGDDDYVMSWDDYYKTYKVPMMDYLAEESIQRGTMNGNIRRISKLPKENKATKEEVVDEKEVVEEIGDNKVEVDNNKKGVNESLKIDVGDGNDYIRKMFNYENTSGSSSGGGVGNYGFTGTGGKGAALKKLYDKAEGTPGEKGIKVVNEYIIGTSPSQKKGDYGTTILADLGIDRKAYDGLDDSIKEQLVDWKFNTGRGSADLIAIASGVEIDGKKWDGKKAFEKNSPTPEQIEDVDYSKLTPKALYDARQELYIKRIQGMEEMLKKDPDNKKLKSDLEFARDGYNNSQINRFKVEEKTNEELVADFE